MTQNKESTKWFSDRQELAVSRAIGGRRTVMSGAAKFSKGDVVTNDWLIECKTQVKEKESFSIKKEWLKKATEEAFSMNKSHVALAFNFGGENQSQNFYVISEKDFKRLVELE